MTSLFTIRDFFIFPPNIVGVQQYSSIYRFLNVLSTSTLHMPLSASVALLFYIDMFHLLSYLLLIFISSLTYSHTHFLSSYFDYSSKKRREEEHCRRNTTNPSNCQELFLLHTKVESVTRAFLLLNFVQIKTEDKKSRSILL